MAGTMCVYEWLNSGQFSLNSALTIEPGSLSSPPTVYFMYFIAMLASSLNMQQGHLRLGAVAVLWLVATSTEVHCHHLQPCENAKKQQ